MPESTERGAAVKLSGKPLRKALKHEVVSPVPDPRVKNGEWFFAAMFARKQDQKR